MEAGGALRAVRRLAVDRYNPVLWEVAWWGLALGLGVVLGSLGGNEWQNFQRATLKGFLNFQWAGNPPYTGLLLYPLALLPFGIGSTMFRFLSICCLYLISRLGGANKWLLLLSFPALWLITVNQLDGLVALGAALGYWSIKHKKPFWQGIATLLLCIKPHIGGPLALGYSIWQRDWRTLPISVGVVVASFGLWGFWPGSYARHLITQSQGGYIISHFGGDSVDLFPYGFLFWPLLAIPAYRAEQRIAGIVAATMLSVPYAAGYSLLSLMAMPLPIWVYPVISAGIVGAGVQIVRLAPIAVIIYPVIIYLYKRAKRVLTKE